MAVSTEIIKYVKYDKFENGKLGESVEKIIDTREIDKLELPSNCVRFQFYDRLKRDYTKEDNHLELITEKMNISPMYYIGKEYSLEQIGKDFGRDSEQYLNMLDILAARAVKVCSGDFFILGQDEKVLSYEQVGVKEPIQKDESQARFF